MYALDLLTRVTDAHDNITTIAYDSAGRKTSMRDPDMGSWGYTYDVASNLVAQTDPKRQTTVFGYDNLNRLTTKIAPTSRLVSDVFNTKDTTAESEWEWGTGQTVPFTEGTNNVVKNYANGAWSHMTRSAYTLTSRESVKLRFKVSNNNTSAHFMVEADDPDDIHNAAHPRFAVREHEGELKVQATDGTGFRDVTLLPELVVNQWYTLNLALDDEGGFTAYVFPDGQPYNGKAYRTFLPNARGLTWRFRHMLDQGTTYIDDYAEFDGAAYRYDRNVNGKGLRSTMISPEGQQSWLYDSRGRVRQMNYSRTGLTGGRYMYTEYDAADRVQSLTYPSGEKVTYTYDGGGRQTKLCSDTYDVCYADEASFDALDQPYAWKLGNGLYSNWIYTLAMRRPNDVKVGITPSGAGSGRHYFSRYRYDGVGNITSLIRYNGSSQVNETETFAYDERDRLVSASGDGFTDGTATYNAYSDTFGYDAIGNLTFKDGRAYAYPENGVRPHAVTCTNSWSSSTACDPNKSYTYDANGNVTSGGGRTFTWTAENQLATVTSGPYKEAYLYDADGARVKRASTYTNSAGGATTTTTYYFGGLAEETGDGTKRHVYTFNGQVIAERETQTGTSVPSTFEYLHSDHLGSIVATSSSDTTPTVQRQYFTPWGEQRGAEIWSTERNFTGQKKDARTGLLFYNARYYDPVLGRFISADSIVPGMASGAGGMGSIGADDSTGSMLTVDFHEPVFVAGVGAENTFTRERGFSFELSDEDWQDAKYQGGPFNPQALNRYSYVLNNPVRYTDPTGHCAECAIALAFSAAGITISAPVVAAIAAAIAVGAIVGCLSTERCRNGVINLVRRGVHNISAFVDSLSQQVGVGRYYVPPGLNSRQRSIYREAVHIYKRRYGLGPADNVPKGILDQIADAIKGGDNAYDAADAGDPMPEDESPSRSRRGR